MIADARNIDPIWIISFNIWKICFQFGYHSNTQFVPIDLNAKC